MIQVETLDWEKMNGLLPAVIQHINTGEVLMVGYMNQEALSKTLESQQLILYSRSKQRLWRKGETSGNTMSVQTISRDCDKDCLLVQVLPAGPACHLGFNTCFPESQKPHLGFLQNLIEVIAARSEEDPKESYTASLLEEGVSRVAQKVGEEATETVIAAVKGSQKELITESADLLFHLLVLLYACNVSFYDVVTCLQQRHSLRASLC